VKKIYLNFLSRQMKQYEQSILSKMDGLLWISDRDRKEMNLPALYGKQMIYPFTIQLPPAEKNQARDKQAPVFFHIGSMDWEPNIEGINWFLQKVWSRVNLKSAALTFRIAGKNMPDKLQQLQLKGFENVGEVKDAQAFMREGDVMVVPLFSGSGIRVKIVEAMAMGKTVLTTQKGVEGIEGTPGVHWFSADGQDSFLERIHFIVEHTEEREKVGAAGRELVEKLFSANKFFPQIKDFILQAQAHE
jgi:glycosyltransferase involved in cell wall biosynthesis